MKKIKRILTVLIAAAVSVTAMVSTAFMASAKGVFDDAITMKPMTYYSYQFGKQETIYYKITLNSGGTLTFFCEQGTGWSGPEGILVDENMNTCDWFYCSNNKKKEIKDLSKGTYYLKIYSDGQSFTNLYYSFVSDGKSSVKESNDEPTVSIALKLKVGETARVSAVSSDYDGSIRWKTTKKSVATVSKGKITAKSKGKARIRAYLDDGSYTEITVIVED